MTVHTSPRVFRLLVGTRPRALLTILAWILITVALTLTAPTTDSGGGEAGSAPADAPSTVAGEQVDELSAAAPAGSATDDAGPPAIITVTTGDAGSTDNATTAVLKLLQNRDGVTGAISPLCANPAGGLTPSETCIPGSPDGTVSADGTTRTIAALITGSPDDDDYQDRMEAFRADISAAADSAVPGAETHVTGPAGVSNDLTGAFKQADWVLGAATMVIVLVILLAVYRSPVLAVLPLLTVGVTLMAVNAVIAWLGTADLLVINSQSTSILTVLLFGVGTDYALIVNARYREEIGELADAPADGDSSTQPWRRPHGMAMARALHRATSSLLSSAGTIVLALLMLLIAVTPTLRNFGPFFATGIVVLVIAAFTLLPAFIVACGDAVFWPGDRAKAAKRAHDDGVWGKIAGLVDKRPGAVLAGTLAVVLALSAGLFGYKESYDIVSGLRVESDAKDGQAVISRDIGPGEVAPEALVLTAQSGLTPEVAQQVAEKLPEVIPDVVSRATVDGGGAAVIGELPSPAGVRPSDSTARPQQAVSMKVILANDPYAQPAMDSLPELEATVAGIAGRAGAVDAKAAAAGDAADNRDLRDSVHRDMLLLLPALLIVVGVVLGVLLKSILAPFYLTALQTLGLAATLGATVVVTMWIGGDEGIGAQVPSYILIFAIALGVDYTIFLMDRYRQELANHAPRAAMRRALTRTGGVVSSAGLILAATFAVLTVMPVRELFQFGTGMAIGILLDTFIVRPLMVPAIVRILGRHALWPTTPKHEDEPEPAA